MLYDRKALPDCSGQQPGTLFHPIEDSSASAAVCAPLLADWYTPRTVLDLGCNVGAWVWAFRALGIKATGVDGPGMDADVEWDLRKPNPPLGGPWLFDLVLCLEVAEHLEPEYADVLVGTATAHSDRVIWSAATPGQGGYHHVNEQPLDYWIEKFSRLGFNGVRLADRLPVLPHDYYRKNMLCFTRATH